MDITVKDEQGNRKSETGQMTVRKKSARKSFCLSWPSITPIEITIPALFFCCTFFCGFLVELLRLNSFGTTGVEWDWWTYAACSLCRELLKMSRVKAAEKVFPASPITMVRLYRRAVQTMPVQVCDAPDNSRDGRRPRTPNKHLQLWHRAPGWKCLLRT